MQHAVSPDNFRVSVPGESGYGESDLSGYQSALLPIGGLCHSYFLCGLWIYVCATEYMAYPDMWLRVPGFLVCFHDVP